MILHLLKLHTAAALVKMISFLQKHARHTHITNEWKADGDRPNQKIRQTRLNERAPGRFGTLERPDSHCRVFNVYLCVSWCLCGMDEHRDGRGVKADFSFLWIRT